MKNRLGVSSKMLLVQKTIFYKIFNSKHLHYLFKLIPSRSSSYVTRNINNITFLKQDILFKKTLSSHLLLSNGINLIITYKSLAVSIFSGKVSRNLSGHLLIVFLTVIIPKDSDFITRLWLGLSQVSPNSNTVFKIL